MVHIVTLWEYKNPPVPSNTINEIIFKIDKLRSKPYIKLKKSEIKVPFVSSNEENFRVKLLSIQPSKIFNCPRVPR